MVKVFCDGCGVEIGDLFEEETDFAFTRGVFCPKCKQKGDFLNIEYRQQADQLRQLFVKKLEEGR